MALVVRGTTVLIVDDDPMILRLLHRLFEDDERARVVGEACDGRQALDRWTELQPDVVVLDQMMPELTGLEVADRILTQRPGQRIIMLTAVTDESLRSDAQRIGIEAWVQKTELASITRLM